MTSRPLLLATCALLTAVPARADLTAPSTLLGPATQAPLAAPASIAPPAMAPVPRPLSPQTTTERPQAGALAARCGEGGEGGNGIPRIARLEDNTHAKVLRFDEAGGLYGGFTPLQSEARHLAPGETFTLQGGCFGDSPGSVELVWESHDAQANTGNRARLALGERRIPALIDSWQNGLIRGRVPHDLSGLLPGRLGLTVRTADGQQVSNAVHTGFWPKWVELPIPRASLSLVHCEDAAPMINGACRGGDALYQPHTTVPYPTHPEIVRKPIAGAHRCLAAGGCTKNRRPEYSGKDVYRFTLPAWQAPVITAYMADIEERREKNRARSAKPTLTLIADGPDTPLSRPRSYTLEVAWVLAQPDSSAFYAIDLVSRTPAGLEPEKPMFQPGPITRPSPALQLPGARVRMKDLPR
ncbi:MAG: hypothetical protein AB1421_12695 [Pseudomonadota bacterium]